MSSIAPAAHPYTAIPTTLVIVPSRTNRTIFDADALQELAASIKAYGVLQPILVRMLPGERLQDTFEDEATRHATHEIVAGERRWRAAKIAGLREIPVLVRQADDSVALVLQLLENLQREDLNPLEEARGIHRLIEEHGYTREQAADALRKSRTHVFEAQRLLLLCTEAQDAIRAGTLNRSVALLVAQRPTQPPPRRCSATAIQKEALMRWFCCRSCASRCAWIWN